MESNYYLPLINEFKVGFRYEQFIHEGGISWSGMLHDAIQKSWIKKIYEIDNPDSFVDIGNYIDSGFIRVKKLDEADIIEAGWKENENQSPSYCTDYLLGDEWSLDIFDSERGIRIMSFTEIRFFGKIKNYNELLKVMEMLNINSSENVKR